MEFFIATSIKSFDLNPTHPGPLETTRTGNLRKDDDKAQIFKPPPLMARSAIRSRECRVRGN